MYIHNAQVVPHDGIAEPAFPDCVTVKLHQLAI